MPNPVAARSQAWVYNRSLVRIAGSNTARGVDVCCECCVLSGRGLCEKLITRTEYGVSECGCEVSAMRWPWPIGGCCGGGGGGTKKFTRISQLEINEFWCLC
jgi:hypothetical protein